MKKAFCIISNILLSIFYISVSWVLSVVSFLFMTGMSWSWSPDEVIGFLLLIVVFLTPVFCVLGIVLSVIQRKRENYATAFWIQFLPFAMIGITLVAAFVASFFVEVFV